MNSNKSPKKIANANGNYNFIEIYGSVEVIVNGKRHELDFNGCIIGEAFAQINKLKLWDREYFWRWAGLAEGEDRIILVTATAGDTDFMDFARFVDWLRVFMDGDGDDYDSEA